MELWELVARESIRDITARYNANGDAGRIEQMTALFADDAVLEIVGGDSYQGQSVIGDFFRRVAKPEGEAPKVNMLRHYTATLQIDIVDEGVAKGRCYFAVLTENGLDHWGRYIDDYCCRDGKWLFKHRKVTVDGQTPGGWSAQRGRRV